MSRYTIRDIVPSYRTTHIVFPLSTIEIKKYIAYVPTPCDAMPCIYFFSSPSKYHDLVSGSFQCTFFSLPLFSIFIEYHNRLSPLLNFPLSSLISSYLILSHFIFAYVTHFIFAYVSHFIFAYFTHFIFARIYLIVANISSLY